MTMCFTINGFMGDMFTGPQADCGRYLSDNPVDHGIGVARWQPVGYDSSQFPLSNGAKLAVAEFQNQRRLHPGPYVAAVWSLGAVAFITALKAELVAGNTDCKGVAAYGNPYRAAGQWNPSGAALGAVPDPGGAGVGGPGVNWVAPPFFHNYCHGPNQPSYDGKPGIDQYTCCSTGKDGDVARIFYNFVFAQWVGGFEEIFVVAKDVATNTGMTLFAAIEAAYEWISFFSGNTAAHQNYDAYAGKTYLANVVKGLQ